MTSDLHSRERQVAPTLDGIRKDHRARYEWVARREAGRRLVDAACGVGYGTKVLARAGNSVTAFDRSDAAIQYAAKHYNHEPAVQYRTGDLLTFKDAEADAVVCFEGLEHVEDPGAVLANFARMAPRLYVSVPNEDVFPYRGHAFHHRHYTARHLEELLNRFGWEVAEWWGQAGTEADPERNVSGRTLIAVCERTPNPRGGTAGALSDPVKQAPESVAIVAMGDSSRTWMGMASQLGGRRRVVDEVWAINAMGGVIQHDRLFHMDDMRLQEARAAADPKGGVAGMMGWLRNHPGPVYTSKAYPEFPGAVEFPLAEVMTSTGHGYFNSTIPYAVAYAIHIGVRQLHMYGCDYSYPNAHKREKGRACLEFWLGIASARGIQITLPQDTTLMDAKIAHKKATFYGYDAENLVVRIDDDGFKVERTPEPLPSVEEIELRYSHDEALEAKLEEALA